jgi:hypothetical protein
LRIKAMPSAVPKPAEREYLVQLAEKGRNSTATGLQSVPRNCTKLHQIAPNCTKLHQIAPDCTRLRSIVLETKQKHERKEKQT